MKYRALLALAPIVFVLSVGPSNAADKAPAKPAPAAVVIKPVFSWTGMYAGFSAGWARSNFNWAFNPPVVAGANQTFTLERSGFEGDVHVGIQHQLNHLVLGIEGQALFFLPGWANHDGYGVGTGQAQARIATVYTVGPRLGIAQANHLFYVTGGYATGHIETQGRGPTGSIAQVTSVDQHGWFAGAGVDWAVSKYTILGVEYQHVALLNKLHCVAPCVLTNTNNHDISATADVVSLRLSWLFPIK